VERALAGSAAVRLGRRRRAGQRLILAYHNVVPGGQVPDGDRSLHLDFDVFRGQLDALARASVVSLEAALSPSHADPILAISFDDAYASAVTLALPELAGRGLPATMFVAPGLLGQGAPWWDRLAVGGAVPEAVRGRCLDAMGGETARIESELGSSMSERRNPLLSIASIEQLRRAAELPGVTFGSHSWGHPNLCAQSEAGLGGELRRPLEWLRASFPAVTRPWVAYPYGFSNADVEAAARAVGYEAGFAVTGGWSGGRDRRMALPRLNIARGLSVDGFRARIAGLLDL
jgi:peptidoglycan/xylan/chitin deacetylase (PgdA/CDA1 family)